MQLRLTKMHLTDKAILSKRVYATARDLEPQYDELSLIRLRSRPNDELLMAIAMALHGQAALPDDGSIVSDLQACPGSVSIDVLRGRATLRNPPPPDPRHVDWYRFTKVHPLLVHFLGGFTTGHPYRREELRLELAAAQRWPLLAADVVAMTRRSIPMITVRSMKDLFRPIYHRFFGPRRVSGSDRL
jgi:hypothetical protein